MDEDQDDPSPDKPATPTPPWWQQHTEEALRDLHLYPVPVETMGHTTSTPGGW